MKELPLLGDSHFFLTPVYNSGMHNHLEGLWKNELKSLVGGGRELYYVSSLITSIIDN